MAILLTSRRRGQRRPDALPTPREYGPRDPEFSGVIDPFIGHHADLQKVVA